MMVMGLSNVDRQGTVIGGDLVNRSFNHWGACHAAIIPAILMCCADNPDHDLGPPPL